MKLEKGYWIDGNENKWNADLFSKEQAEEYSSSLIDCYDCVDSSSCKDCRHCENCFFCLDCYECKFCIYCEDCENCKNCKNCSDCIYCLSCEKCEKCENCENCDFLQKCKGLTQKSKLINISLEKKEENDTPKINDNVNSPVHYNKSKYEVIDEMLMIFGKEEVMAFCKLNAYKYFRRANFKGKFEEDVQKANWYLDKLNELKK